MCISITHSQFKTPGAQSDMPMLSLPYLVIHQLLLFLIPGLEKEEGHRRKAEWWARRSSVELSITFFSSTLSLHPLLQPRKQEGGVMEASG